MIDPKDITVFRDLAKTYAAIAAKPIQDERRQLWSKHNSLVRTRPPVLCMGLFFWHELNLEESLQCQHPLLRGLEKSLRQAILHDQLNDDSIAENFLKVPACYVNPIGVNRWGVEIRHSGITAKGGSWKFVPALANEDDLKKLVAYDHQIDEEATARRLAMMQEVVGDILPIVMSRTPAYTGFAGDISTDLARLRGLEQVMWDMLDRPAWLHQVCAFMRDGVLKQHEQAEKAGHWRLSNSNTQVMSYCQDLPNPSASDKPVNRDQLWVFMAAQEMAQVSPAMHEEFILQYQLPIMAKFGLVAYGCCEDLTKKIDMLRQIPNLRRISVTPFANVAACAQQIKQDYVCSWRPSPAEMICNGFNPERIRRVITAGMEASKGCHVDITLKDVQTIGGNYGNLIEWVKIVRGITDKYA